MDRDIHGTRAGCLTLQGRWYDVCGSTQPSRAYKTGSKVTVDGVLYSKTQQGCVATGGDPNGLLFYATTEVAAQDLAEITRETE